MYRLVVSDMRKSGIATALATVPRSRGKLSWHGGSLSGHSQIIADATTQWRLRRTRRRQQVAAESFMHYHAETPADQKLVHVTA